MNQFNEKINQFINSHLGQWPYEWPEPLTEEQLRSLEQALGHFLPTTYREFLRDYGNTVDVPVFALFPMPEREEAHNGAISILGFYGVVSGGIFAPNLEELYRQKPDIVPQEWLPISGEDKSAIFLSLSGDDAGALYLLNPPYGGVEPTKDDIYFLAHSFDEFLDRLAPVPLPRSQREG